MDGAFRASYRFSGSPPLNRTAIADEPDLRRSAELHSKAISAVVARRRRTISLTDGAVGGRVRVGRVPAAFRRMHPFTPLLS